MNPAERMLHDLMHGLLLFVYMTAYSSWIRELINAGMYNVFYIGWLSHVTCIALGLPNQNNIDAQALLFTLLNASLAR